MDKSRQWHGAKLLPGVYGRSAEPTEEEKSIMAANRENRKPLIIDEKTLKTALEKALGELGGW